MHSVFPNDGCWRSWTRSTSPSPSVERIGIYANARNILQKSLDDLTALRERKLGIIYLGVETGDPDLLVKIRKGSTYEQLVEAARRVRGVRYSPLGDRFVGSRR